MGVGDTCDSAQSGSDEEMEGALALDDEGVEAVFEELREMREEWFQGASLAGHDFKCTI